MYKKIVEILICTLFTVLYIIPGANCIDIKNNELDKNNINDIDYYALIIGVEKFSSFPVLE